MNLRDMPEEEELDQMFRQAADLYQPEFDPEAWRAMEEKLNGPTRPKGFIYRRGKEVLVLLLVALTGMFMYLQLQKRELKTPLEKKPEAKVSKATSAIAKLQQKTNPIAPENNTGYSVIPKTSQAENLSRSTKKDKQFRKIITVARTDKTVKDQLLGYKNYLVIDSAQINEGTQISKSEISKNNNSSQNKKIYTNTPQLSETDTTRTNPEEQDALAEILKPALVMADSLDEQDNAQDGVINKEEPTRPEVKAEHVPDSAAAKVKAFPARAISKVGVTVLLGPDFSTVRFVNPEKASTNYGLIVSYHFNKRWAIATGIIKARKVYGAKPEDYHPGAYYWNGRHLPDRIIAVCEVLDIPVNVRYNFVVLPEQSLFVQTGLSSYLMQHEDYRYDYENYGKPYSTHWIVTKQNQHFFKVLNVSAGYNRQLGPVISVGAEPFLKIPLAGIGAGKVNLTSMGVLISIGYRFH